MADLVSEVGTRCTRLPGTSLVLHNGGRRSRVDVPRGTIRRGGGSVGPWCEGLRRLAWGLQGSGHGEVLRVSSPLWSAVIARVARRLRRDHPHRQEAPRSSRTSGAVDATGSRGDGGGLRAREGADRRPVARQGVPRGTSPPHRPGAAQGGSGAPILPVLPRLRGLEAVPWTVRRKIRSSTARVRCATGPVCRNRLVGCLPRPRGAVVQVGVPRPFMAGVPRGTLPLTGTSGTKKRGDGPSSVAPLASRGASPQSILVLMIVTGSTGVSALSSRISAFDASCTNSKPSRTWPYTT